MNQKSEFNFLRVKNGRTYFARVSVVLDPTGSGVVVAPGAGEKDSRISQDWMRAAVCAAEQAAITFAKKCRIEGGLILTSVVGTEVDTDPHTISVAAFSAAWKAMGGDERSLSFRFDGRWQVEVTS